MSDTTTTTKHIPLFSGWEYFSTPIWHGEFPERVPLLNKICDKHIKAAQKINTKAIKREIKHLKKT